MQQTKEWTRSLDEPFVVRLPFDPGTLLVHTFSGDPEKTFLQYDSVNNGLTRQRIKTNLKWKWDSERIVYIVNIDAQPTKSITVLMGPVGTELSGGTNTQRLESSSGITINPATEDKQGDAISDLDSLVIQVGEVQASPTANTLLDRLKSIVTTLGAKLDSLIAARTNQGSLAHGQTTVGTSAVVLAASQAVPNGFGVVVKAGQANTGQVYVGIGGLTTGTGFELSAKESVTLYVNNLDVIYAIATVASQKLSYIVEKAV